MTTLAIAVLFAGSVGYVLWPVFRPAPPGRDRSPNEVPPHAPAQPPAATGRSLPLEQLEPPAGER